MELAGSGARGSKMVFVLVQIILLALAVTSIVMTIMVAADNHPEGFGIIVGTLLSVGLTVLGIHFGMIWTNLDDEKPVEVVCESASKP